MRLTPTVVASLLLATGCVGTVEDIDPTIPTPDAGVTPTGKQGQVVYARDVHPVMVQKCSGAGCHTQAGAMGMYGYAVADAELRRTSRSSRRRPWSGPTPQPPRA